MPGRKYSAGSEYRYGFNGKEDDRDVSEGVQDYGMRIYDARIAKFLSVDPLSDKFAFYTPYQFSGNKPIWAIDLDGAEEFILPRWLSFPEPILTIPRIPIPVQPQPPIIPILPEGITLPQSPMLPPAPSLPVAPGIPMKPTVGTQNLPKTQNGEIDWDGTVNENIDVNDTKTWPTPPKSLKGNWEEVPLDEGMRGFNKNPNQKRLQNEEGGILRPHKVDEQHPKFHWDFKKGGNKNNSWENYTPDGIEIPKGSVYGKDFNPVIVTLPNVNFKGSWKEITDRYEKQLRQYEKGMEKYKKDMEDYRTKMKEYYENCNCQL